MGDLKTFWESKDQIFTGTDTGGAGVVSSGSDPNADGGAGESGLKPMWPDAPLGSLDQAESSNSVSGLPALPNRFEPSESSAEPPDLTDRSPGTIDQQ